MSEEKVSIVSSFHHRIVFIDIDGVLNHQGVLDSNGFDNRLLANFAAMIKSAGASIVLSSTWRLKKKNRAHVKKAFLLHGIPMPIGCTPKISHTKGWRYARVQEILMWLQLNTTIPFQKQDEVNENMENTESVFSKEDYVLPIRINVSHFVALDDINMKIFGGASRHLVADKHFVLTLMKTGVTEHNLKQASLILSDEYDPLDMTEAPLSSRDLKALLPYNSCCEHCEKEMGIYSCYDLTINKYFCQRKCCTDFYSLHFPR